MTHGNTASGALLDSVRSSGGTPQFILFDYDSTIARVPVDWQAARPRCREYLHQVAPSVVLDSGMRVDDMEAAVLESGTADAAAVFQFRRLLEGGLEGAHEPLLLTVDAIRELHGQGGATLIIVSNNLRHTVSSGLRQLGITHCFAAVYGVDDVGIPKPSTRAIDLIRAHYPFDPLQSVFVGDSATDAAFCQRGNLRFININSL